MRYSNQAAVSGTITSALKLDHIYKDEKYYRFTLSIKRTSNTKDNIPVIVSERLIDCSKDYLGKCTQVIGELKTHNIGSHLLVYLQVNNIYFYSYDDNTNNIFLEGNICTEPVYRLTPLGRQITDFTLAVPRMYNKCDYIPCIAWGKTAIYLSSMSKNTHVKILGRIQSRDYNKNGSILTAYELSVINLTKEED